MKLKQYPERKILSKYSAWWRNPDLANRAVILRMWMAHAAMGEPLGILYTAILSDPATALVFWGDD